MLARYENTRAERAARLAALTDEEIARACAAGKDRRGAGKLLDVDVPDLIERIKANPIIVDLVAARLRGAYFQWKQPALQNRYRHACQTLLTRKGSPASQFGYALSAGTGAAAGARQGTPASR